SKQLVDDCHLNSVWETTFKASATTVSERPNRVFDAALSIHDELVSANDAIQGTWFAEGWGYDVDNGHFVNCHRDSRFGGDEPLGLYRHCWYSGLDWVAQYPDSKDLDDLDQENTGFREHVKKFKAALSAATCTGRNCHAAVTI